MEIFMANKTVVYTGIFGDYDDPVKLSVVEEYDYIVLTDNPNLIVPEPWSVRCVTFSNDETNTMKNRMVKFFPMNYLAEYSESIYIDGNVDIIKKLDTFIASAQEYDFQVYKHPDRNSVIAEAAANIWMLRLSDSFLPILKEAIEYYHRQGYQGTELFEANIIYRKHKKTVHLAMLKWLEMFNMFCPRDQIHLPYILWLFSDSIKINKLPPCNSRRPEGVFFCHKHKFGGIKSIPIKIKRKLRMIMTDLDYWIKKIETSNN